MSGTSGSQAEKKTVSIQMDKIGCLEIIITVTGQEVVLTKDGVPQPKIEYKNNLQIIIQDPKAKFKEHKEGSNKPKEISNKPKKPDPQANTGKSKA